MGHTHMHIGLAQLPRQGATVLARHTQHDHFALVRRLHGFNQNGLRPIGADQDQHIAGMPQSTHLSGEGLAVWPAAPAPAGSIQSAAAGRACVRLWACRCGRFGRCGAPEAPAPAPHRQAGAGAEARAHPDGAWWREVALQAGGVQHLDTHKVGARRQVGCGPLGLVQRGVEGGLFKAYVARQLQAKALPGLGLPAQVDGGVPIAGLHGLGREGGGLLRQHEALGGGKRTLVGLALGQLTHAGCTPEVVAHGQRCDREPAAVQAGFVQRWLGEGRIGRHLDAVPAHAGHLGAQQLTTGIGHHARCGGLLVQRRHRLGLDGERLQGLLCTQTEAGAGLGGGTAFFCEASVGAGAEERSNDSTDWTCDRSEFWDAQGRLVLPLQLGQRSGFGLDPCAALSRLVTLRPGASFARVYLLGYAATEAAARALAHQAAGVAAAAREQATLAHWNTLLGATQVRTPDPLLDVLVNRWLLYQTVSSRLYAKAGFYQAGGATGYRDQLQDTMALVWAQPGLLRAQNASSWPSASADSMRGSDMGW
eukprot:gene30880-38163_t